MVIDDAVVAHVNRLILHVIRGKQGRRTMPLGADVDDLRQDVWVRILPELETFDTSRSVPFEAYVYQRIGWALVETQRRGHGWRRYVRGDGPTPAPVRVELSDANVGGSDPGIERQLLMMDVRRIVGRLGPRYEDVLDALLEGHSQRDIADLLGVTQGRVSQMWARMKRQARVALA